jgi:hypothetical protein
MGDSSSHQLNIAVDPVAGRVLNQAVCVTAGLKTRPRVSNLPAARPSLAGAGPSFTGNAGNDRSGLRILSCKDNEMSGKVALQLNAMVGLASTVAASATMWLLLTRPADVAVTVANHDYEAFAVAIGQQLGVWFHAVLRFI